MKMRVTLLAIVIVSVFSGCGEGKDPIGMFANEGTVPTLAFPFTPQAPVTSNKDGLILPVNISSVAVTAPVAGLVTLIEMVTGATYSITIYYNSVYSVRIAQLNVVPTIRVGEYVQAGQLLGTVSGTAQVLFSVFQNGANVCSYSYLDTTARTIVNSNLPVPCPFL